MVGITRFTTILQIWTATTWSHILVRHEVEQPEAPTPWRPRVNEFTFKEHVTSGASMYFLHILWYFSDIFWYFYFMMLHVFAVTRHISSFLDSTSPLTVWESEHHRATLRNEAFIEFSGSPGAALQRFQRQIRCWRRWGAERSQRLKSSCTFLQSSAVQSWNQGYNLGTIWVYGNGRNGTWVGSSQGKDKHFCNHVDFISSCFLVCHSEKCLESLKKASVCPRFREALGSGSHATLERLLGAGASLLGS